MAAIDPKTPSQRSKVVDSDGQAAVTLAEQLPLSSTATSASAALARSLLLFIGLMFRRPSKLFRPNRVDTWGGLRQLALSANQSFSPTFIRDILKRRGGPLAVTLSLLPPLAINTTLGFLLFTSHSLFSLGLARLPFFQRTPPSSSQSSADKQYSPRGEQDRLASNDDVANMQEQDYEENHLTLQTLLQGPSFIPKHPTLLSAIAGAGAGMVQGMAFTPIENVIRFVHQSTTSITAILARVLRLPLPAIPSSSGPTAATPLEALRNLFSSEAWKRSPSWWTGWRWIVARDALSYSCFFAAFDITPRVGLRVKALFGGSIQKDWQNFVTIDFSSSADHSDTNPSVTMENKAGKKEGTPTIARIAQATTIVAGGVSASILAELVGRPFRTCQKIMQAAKSQSRTTTSSFPRSGGSDLSFRMGVRHPNPIIQAYREHGIKPFIQSEAWSQTPVIDTRGGTFKGMAKRVGWKLAGVGPWGFGFLVWAWVGGEV